VTPTYGRAIDSSQQQLGKAKHSPHKVLHGNKYEITSMLYTGLKPIIFTPSITLTEKHCIGRNQWL
jgi:hypothetical protein